MPRASIRQLAAMRGEYEPQRAFQWVMTIQGLSGMEVLELSLRTVTPPSKDVEEIEIPFGNTSIFVPGRVLPQEGTVEFNDYLDKDTAGILERWSNQTADQYNGTVGYSKLIKREATITLYSPDYSDSRVYIIEGLWPKAVTPGTLDYGSSEVLQYSVTFRYDRYRMGENGAAGPGDLASSFGV